MELAYDWNDNGKNPITGLKASAKRYTSKKSIWFTLEDIKHEKRMRATKKNGTYSNRSSNTSNLGLANRNASTKKR